MAKATQTKAEAQASHVSTAALSFEKALVGFALFEEAKETLTKLGDAVPTARRAEVKVAFAEAIPQGVHTSTEIFIKLANKLGGKLFLAKKEEAERVGRKGESAETVRKHLCFYLTLSGMKECVDSYGFNAQFYAAVVKYHRSNPDKAEQLLNFMEATSCNASAVSQAAKAEGHSIFIDGQELNIPTAIKGEKSEKKADANALTGADV